MDFSSSTVMITGASRGLGRALAVAFARAGSRVSACARSVEGLEGLSNELELVGADHLCHAADVSDPEQVAGWMEATRGRLGFPDVLINNASLLGPREPLIEIAVGEWRNVIEANLQGTFVVTRAIAPGMVAAARGSIINVSSGASIPPRTSWGPYAVSKAAVDAFSLNLAAELKGTGVSVNIVDPGALRTAMRADAYPDEDPESLKSAGSIAPLFLWLADPRAGTGQRIQADEWLRVTKTGSS